MAHMDDFGLDAAFAERPRHLGEGRIGAALRMRAAVEE